MRRRKDNEYLPPKVVASTGVETRSEHQAENNRKLLKHHPPKGGRLLRYNAMQSSLPTYNRSSSSYRRNLVKMINTQYPKLSLTTTTLLEGLISQHGNFTLDQDPLEYFCKIQLIRQAREWSYRLDREIITPRDIRDGLRNFIELHRLCVVKRNPFGAFYIAKSMRQLIAIICDMATVLEEMSASRNPIDWDKLVVHMPLEAPTGEQMKLFTLYIPTMRDFEAVAKIGQGGFGAVYRVVFESERMTCAMKLIAANRFSRMQQACMDKVIAAAINSVFLVQYFCCFAVDEAYIAILEYIDGVDVSSVFSFKSRFHAKEARVIIAQVVSGVEHLHLRGFIHRDLKTSNLLIIPGGRCKVIDFDTCKECMGEFTQKPLRSFQRRTAVEFCDKETAGTMAYMAPEVLRKRSYGRSCDWWAVGVILYKLMTGTTPFRGEEKQALKENIINGLFDWPLDKQHRFNTDGMNLVEAFLVKNPSDRIGSRGYNDIKRHAFFKNLDWTVLSQTYDLCNVPAIQQAITARDNKSDSPTNPEQEQQEDKRHFLQPQEVHDKDIVFHKAMHCYAAPYFRRLMEKSNRCGGATVVAAASVESFDEEAVVMPLLAMSDSPPLGGSNPDLTAESSVESEAPVVPCLTIQERGVNAREVEIKLPAPIGCYSTPVLGMQIQKVATEQEPVFIIQLIKPGSPASKKALFANDRILAINGINIGDKTLDDIQQLSKIGLRDVILTVEGNQTVRLLEKLPNVRRILDNIAPVEMVVRAYKSSAVSGQWDRLFSTTEIVSYDMMMKTSYRMHVVQSVEPDFRVLQPPEESLSVGDIVVEFERVALDSLSMDEVDTLLKSSARERNSMTVLFKSAVGTAIERMLRLTPPQSSAAESATT